MDSRGGRDLEELARLSKKSLGLVRARVSRYQVWQMATLLHKWPWEVEEMPIDWWHDGLLFEATESYAGRAKIPRGSDSEIPPPTLKEPDAGS